MNEQGLPVQLICHTKSLIIIAIFKMMALRDTLVYQSTIGPLANYGLPFRVVCFVFVSGQAL